MEQTLRCRSCPNSRITPPYSRDCACPIASSWDSPNWSSVASPISPGHSTSCKERICTIERMPFLCSVAFPVFHIPCRSLSKSVDSLGVGVLIRRANLFPKPIHPARKCHEDWHLSRRGHHRLRRGHQRDRPQREGSRSPLPVMFRIPLRALSTTSTDGESHIQWFVCTLDPSRHCHSIQSQRPLHGFRRCGSSASVTP